MIRRAIQYLQETSIQPADRHIEFSDVDGVDRSFLIDNEGIATEVEQPTSEFVFRMKDGPRAALFEADGGVWKHKAIKNIKQYLEEQFKEEIENDNFIIIA